MNTQAVAAARDLGPLIREHRNETEENRCLAPAIVERLIGSRLCRLAVAAEHDGLALPPTEALDVYEALSAEEASVGWIVWNNALPCFFGRFLDPETRAEIFADSGWLYASSTRPTGKAFVDPGGYRIAGRWSLVSGCGLAEWIALMCVVHDGDAPRMIAPGVPELRAAFVRRDALRILDTWHVGGLRGTGSHDVVVDGARVPHNRTISPADPITLDAPLGRVPMIATMAAGFAAQALGIARAALRTLVDLGSKAAVDGGPGLRDRPSVQLLVAQQTAAAEAASDYLRRRLGTLWAAAERGTDAPPLAEIGSVWAAAYHAVDVAKVTIEGVYAAAGTTALYTSCPLERAHRDLHAMLRHIVSQRFWVEDAGKLHFGVPPGHPLFAV
jgi:alkylation response protein AidB-like acyl-CoA dehydrogenase